MDVGADGTGTGVVAKSERLLSCGKGEGDGLRALLPIEYLVNSTHIGAHEARCPGY